MRRGRRGALFGAAALAAMVMASPGFADPAGATAADDRDFGSWPPPEPEGFRSDDYRSATPRALSGARTVDTAEAERLWRERGALFVDVMPRDPRPDGLPAGTIWRDRPRDDIPGSVWLPNVGYGTLDPEVANYFRDGLAALSGRDAVRPMLFYCRAACWMSWNAAKRAMAAGRSNVIWYPAGTDGWADAGLPLAPATPYEPPSPTTARSP